MRLLPLALLLFVGVAMGQALPAPSRTVYKCEEGGKIRYSDSPCLGAKKLEVEPTRGMNTFSGQKRVGQDVVNERSREALREGLKPLTGMDSKQMDQFGRRQKLTAGAQRQCRALDVQLPEAEAVESSAKSDADLKAAQRRVFELRTAYHKLGCD